jgi:nitric oxide dioxygenase
MFSESAIPYIKASVPVLREHGVKITTIFYANLFKEHPSLLNTFNMSNQADGIQQQSLAAAVFAYAANFENPSALAPVITRIVHKHASLGVTADLYPIVGTHLLGAIKEVLGEAASPELIAAWAEAYGVLANALIEEEKKLYGKTAVPGNLTKMRVTEIIEQSPTAKTLKLRPLLGELMPSYKPGQYVTTFVTFSDGHRQPRQYSLADAPGSAYTTITIKKETKSEEASSKSVSNWIHNNVNVGDTLEVSHPYGEFIIDISSEKPIVLLAAGVGITPMISALNQLVKLNSKQSVHLLYAIKSAEEWLHREDIEKAVELLPSFVFKLYNGQESASTSARLSALDIPHDTLIDADIYMCGSTGFMREQKELLLQHGVDVSRIHREVFGPDLLEDVIGQ